MQMVSQAQTTEQQSSSLALRWYVLIVMMLVYTLSIADRYMVSTVQEQIQHDLHLSDGGIGTLNGATLGLFYVMIGFPISWLIDRGNRRNIITFSIVFWSFVTTATAFVANFWQYALTRIGVGVGEAGGTPGANSIVSDYFPVSRRPMALGIFALGAPIGAYISTYVTGLLADHYGWRHSFLVLGIPGLIVGLLIYFTVREPKRGQLDSGAAAESATLAASLRFLWTQKAAIHVMVGTALTALWGWGLAWWTPSFLQRIYGLSVGQAAELTSHMHLYGGSIATIAMSWLISRPAFVDPRRIVWVMGTVIGIATIASWFIYSSHSLAVTKALFWVFIPAIYFYIGPSFGLVNNLCRPGMRAQFCAVTLFLANVCNLVIAPIVVGWLSNWFAPNHSGTAESLRTAMLFLVPVGAWSTFHYFWSARELVQDQERATGVKVQS